MDSVPFDVLFPYLEVSDLHSLVLTSRYFYESINSSSIVRELCNDKELPQQDNFSLFYRLYMECIPREPLHDFSLNAIGEDNWLAIRNLLRLYSKSDVVLTYNTEEVYHATVLSLLIESIQKKAVSVVFQLCEIGLESLSYDYVILSGFYVTKLLRGSLCSLNASIIRHVHSLLMRLRQLEQFRDHIDSEIHEAFNDLHMGVRY